MKIEHILPFCDIQYEPISDFEILNKNSLCVQRVYLELSLEYPFVGLTVEQVKKIKRLKKCVLFFRRKKGEYKLLPDDEITRTGDFYIVFNPLKVKNSLGLIAKRAREKCWNLEFVKTRPKLSLNLGPLLNKENLLK